MDKNDSNLPHLIDPLRLSHDLLQEEGLEELSHACHDEHGVVVQLERRRSSYSSRRKANSEKEKKNRVSRTYLNRLLSRTPLGPGSLESLSGAFSAKISSSFEPLQLAEGNKREKPQPPLLPQPDRAAAPPLDAVAQLASSVRLQSSV